MQIFHPVANVISKATVFGFIAAVVFAVWILGVVYRSSYATEVDVARQQPVQFSHQHHVGGLGIDCRYCHSSVETSDFAGLPPTQTCMNCHSHVWAESPMLEPVRESWRTGRPLAWTRVHDLPDFAFFSHQIHVAKGVGCVTCHGEVDRMPLMWKNETLFMEWCLSCHREPERFVRPREAVFSTDWTPPADASALRKQLVREYDVQRKTDCYTCHR